MSSQKALNKIDEAFDSMWSGFEKLWKKFEQVLDDDDELPETTKINATVRIRLTPKQLSSLLTGERKRLLFKVKDGTAIQVEIKP